MVHSRLDRHAKRPAKTYTRYLLPDGSRRRTVREWLRELSKDDRRLIGGDIQTVEFGWPIGMPVCRPLGNGIQEVRTDLPGGRIARVLFYVDAKHRMVLLHSLIKKTQRTPDKDLNLAISNMKKHKKGLK